MPPPARRDRQARWPELLVDLRARGLHGLSPALDFTRKEAPRLFDAVGLGDETALLDLLDEIRRAHDFREFGIQALEDGARRAGRGGEAVPAEKRRTDPEVEFSVVIGRKGTDIPRARAMEYVAGYAIGLDMTLRGPELPSSRKSIDSYAVLGPWLVTADELADPHSVEMRLTVNGELRQEANTRDLLFDMAAIIENAARFYTLYPGDVIMTGTPEGVAPIRPGDRMEIEAGGIGKMTVDVRTHTPD